MLTRGLSSGALLPYLLEVYRVVESTSDFTSGFTGLVLPLSFLE
jgi:hypothetical protein